MDKKLRPCPFCGGEAEILTIKNNIDYSIDTHEVFCKDCESYGLQSTEKGEVIRAWNNRPIEAELEKEINRLNTTLKYEITTSVEDKARLEKERDTLRDQVDGKYGKGMMFGEMWKCGHYVPIICSTCPVCVDIKRLEKENAELKSQINEWICEECKVVHPYQKSKEGFSCVVCPDCNKASYMTLSLYEKRRLQKKLAQTEKEKAELVEGLKLLTKRSPMLRIGNETMCGWCKKIKKTHSDTAHAINCPYEYAKALLAKLEPKPEQEKSCE